MNCHFDPKLKSETPPVVLTLNKSKVSQRKSKMFLYENYSKSHKLPQHIKNDQCCSCQGLFCLLHIFFILLET